MHKLNVYRSSIVIREKKIINTALEQISPKKNILMVKQKKCTV